MDLKLIKELILLAFILFIGVFTPICIGVSLLEQRSCNKYQEVTGRQTKYIWFDTCYVSTENNGWLTKDEYSKVIIAREGLSYQK